MRRTKIICTLGPATDNPQIVSALIKNGMDAARFNFSHGTHEEQEKRMNLFTSIRDSMGKPVAAILDTKGPEIRIRSFGTPTVTLQEGSSFTLTAREVEGDETRVSVTYSGLPQEIRPGQIILIDDGLIAVKAEEISGDDIHCRVINGGTLSANKSINVPGASIRLPALTEKDISDIKFGIAHDFDYIAASFVRQASDVRDIRQVLEENGGGRIRIIAKIENQEGVDHLDEILSEADGIMVARGDLGVEIPAAKVPILQKKMIKKALEQGKPVITATQMLDSMMRNPRPTRAEVSDVANAVFDGTSCVMLSGETAGGKYPLESLRAMDTIVRETEQSIDYWARFPEDRPISSYGINDAITHTCCLTAKDLEATAIFTATETGHTARMIARFRPACPVTAMTMNEKVRRQMAIYWGVMPYSIGKIDSTDRMFSVAEELARREGIAKVGDVIVVTAGVPLGRSVATNLLKAHQIEEAQW